MKHSFTVIKRTIENKESWIAMSLELVGCVGLGKTAEEAIAVLSVNESILLDINLETDTISFSPPIKQHESDTINQCSHNPICNENKQTPVEQVAIPEMVTIKEASKRTGLSYDYLRKQCIKGNIIHILVGNGKRLINMDALKEKMMISHGDIGSNK